MRESEMSPARLCRTQHVAEFSKVEGAKLGKQGKLKIVKDKDRLAGVCKGEKEQKLGEIWGLSGKQNCEENLERKMRYLHYISYNINQRGGRGTQI